MPNIISRVLQIFCPNYKVLMCRFCGDGYCVQHSGGSSKVNRVDEDYNPIPSHTDWEIQYCKSCDKFVCNWMECVEDHAYWCDNLLLWKYDIIGLEDSVVDSTESSDEMGHLNNSVAENKLIEEAVPRRESIRRVNVFGKKIE